MSGLNWRALTNGHGVALCILGASACGPRTSDAGFAPLKTNEAGTDGSSTVHHDASADVTLGDAGSETGQMDASRLDSTAIDTGTPPSKDASTESSTARDATPESSDERDAASDTHAGTGSDSGASSGSGSGSGSTSGSGSGSGSSSGTSSASSSSCGARVSRTTRTTAARALTTALVERARLVFASRSVSRASTSPLRTSTTYRTCRSAQATSTTRQK